MPQEDNNSAGDVNRLAARNQRIELGLTFDDEESWLRVVSSWRGFDGRSTTGRDG